MESSDQSNEVPNPDGRPPVRSVEFIRAFRRLVQDDPRWERDEASRRDRDYWTQVMLLDDAGGYPDELSRDTELAHWWSQRLLIDDEQPFHLEDIQAWNNPIFQEFLGRWWHPGVRLPFLASEV